MDPKIRYIQLGKSALQCVVQRYLIKYPQLQAEEVVSIGKLVSSNTFLQNVGLRSAYDIGEMCSNIGIAAVETHVNDRVGPKITQFLGLRGPEEPASGLNQEISPLITNRQESAPLCEEDLSPHQQIDTNLQSGDLNHQNHHLQDTPPPYTPGADLFESFSDEALLKDSSFMHGTQNSSNSGKNTSEFDLLDADSWYKR